MHTSCASARHPPKKPLPKQVLALYITMIAGTGTGTGTRVLPDSTPAQALNSLSYLQSAPPQASSLMAVGESLGAQRAINVTLGPQPSVLCAGSLPSSKTGMAAAAAPAAKPANVWGASIGASLGGSDGASNGGVAHRSLANVGETRSLMSVHVPGAIPAQATCSEASHRGSAARLCQQLLAAVGKPDISTGIAEAKWLEWIVENKPEVAGKYDYCHELFVPVKAELEARAAVRMQSVDKDKGPYLRKEPKQAFAALLEVLQKPPDLVQAERKEASSVATLTARVALLQADAALRKRDVEEKQKRIEELEMQVRQLQAGEEPTQGEQQQAPKRKRASGGGGQKKPKADPALFGAHPHGTAVWPPPEQNAALMVLSGAALSVLDRADAERDAERSGQSPEQSHTAPQQPGRPHPRDSTASADGRRLEDADVLVSMVHDDQDDAVAGSQEM